jgi:phytoene synthase
MGKVEKGIFKAGSTTYYFSSKFFPRKIRDDVFKLYSFVRVADDYVDAKPAQPKKLEQLAKDYKQAIADPNFESITHQWDELETRVVKNIVQVSRKYKFDEAWVPGFLKAMQSDVSPKAHQTLDASLDYVYGSAEVIGLMMTKIMGIDRAKNIRRVLHTDAIKRSHASEKIHQRVTKNTVARTKYRLNKETKVTKEQIEKERMRILHAAQMQGRAMQWINFVRDIKEDNELGRQYIPAADLKKFGLKDLREETARENPQAFEKLIALQLKRYRAWQQEANDAMRFIPKLLRAPLRTAVDMYDWTAQQIEKDPLIVYSKKVKPRKRRVLIRAGRRTLPISKS